MTLGRTIYELWAVRWTEHERGWGQRPDGMTFFETEEEAKDYIRSYWEREKKRNPSGVTPDEYSLPETPALIEVSESLYRAVVFEGSRHSYDVRSYEQAKAMKVSNTCVKHRWYTGEPSLTGK